MEKGSATKRKSPQPDLKPLLNEAIQNHQRGRLDEAGRLYKKILRKAPKNIDALHLTGVVHYQKGRLSKAVHHIRQAIAIRPQPSFYSNLGNALGDMEQFDEAIECYRTAIELAPDFPDPQHNLPSTLQEQCKLDEAIVEYEKALQLDPDNPETHFNYASALLLTNQ